MVTNTFAYCIVVLVMFLAASTAAAVELPDSRCYDFANGTHFGCDTGRCCSQLHYCGDTDDYCSGQHCAFQCISAPEAEDHHVLLSINVTATTFVKVTRNEYYDHHRISSNDSLSCANSLKNLSSASLHKYSWASFHVNNNTIACGHCLKLTNTKTGAEAIVRVVNESTTTAATTESDEVGLELGTATFNKLRTSDREGDDHHDLDVKYNIESCD
ncbi:Wound-induced protein WIN2 [Linum grandiflorum]